MANPISPVDGNGLRLGYFVEKVSTTLTAIIGRAITRAATTGATDVGHLGVATHKDADDAAFSDASSAIPVVLGGVYDGTKARAARGNLEGTLLASAARTATTDSADQSNYSGRGVIVYIKATALSATPSVVPKVQGKDPVTGDYYDLLVGAAITTAAPTVVRLVVYPGVVEVANLAASLPLPRTWRVRMEAADADSLTYSVGYALSL